ncbi:flagellar basal body-associated FliL family protein [Desulfovibrio sp. ZJ369]|uniref:flagellar basal body-associated FliL family protein n=1 Tax=Desulfovibrio sp. ZJ369 TaxID=2709793 RepID=UPI0013EAB4AB|nr:flagellar basal body-associated FliL family protein [Desulfovibrio sp. ZJ369]
MAAKDSARENPALPEGQAEKPRKKSRIKRIVILLAILLMTFSGVGLGAYWWLFLRTPASGAHAPASEQTAPAPGSTADGQAKSGASGQTEEGAPASGAVGAGGPDTGGQADPNAAGAARIERQSDLPRSAGQVLPLPLITVNLSDPGGRRYLKLGMEVEVNADVSAQLKAQSARIRDAIIMLLAGKTFNDIATPDGKVLLKTEVAARLNQIFGAQRVIRIYFTDFVVE